MTCRTVFKIDISRISDDEMYEIIDTIGIEPGITDNYLYYGLLQCDTEENEFNLYEELNKTLSIIYGKKEIIKKLTNIYNISYVVDVKFSDIESELERGTSFVIADESKDFIEYVGAYYNLNNGYFDY